MTIQVRTRTLPLALLALALLLPEGAAANSADRIIVKREPGLSAGERADIRSDAGVRLVGQTRLPQTEVVAADDVRDALRELRADDDVIYAELDRPVRALDHDEYFDLQWGLQAMEVPDGWTLSTGTGASVAVVDTGVDDTHPDLLGKVGDGYDWVGDDTEADDLNGHGTHVAGTIAAIRGNVEGIAGVAPGATILPLRVLDHNGEGFTSDVAMAFDYAGDHGVRIVNASLGSSAFSTTERNAIAAHPGTLYVVAAGNGGPDGVGDNNDGAVKEYPCAYDLANILCVGASNEDDLRASFSNFGPTSVDLFAPGVDIVSTWPGANYLFSQGTSMATPHVAGTAGLLLEDDPATTAAQVKTAIMDTVDFVPALQCLSVSGGRVNAAAALGLVATSPSPPLDCDGDGVSNASDNCPATANGGQADADGDAVGDACDPTPRGPDADGDGKPALDDRCPAEFAATADGCPVVVVVPPPIVETVPAFTSLSAKVSGRRTVKVRVGADRAATIGVTVERKRCKRGKCRWVRVARRIVTANGGSATVTVKRLKLGSHRARVTLSNIAGATKPRTVRFSVR